LVKESKTKDEGSELINRKSIEMLVEQAVTQRTKNVSSELTRLQ